jgi:3-methyladenine DNA glycosylase/8-oxoguanine DNA glycosylase
VSDRLLTIPDRYDLRRSVGRLAVIPGDPTVRADARESWWATRTPDGPGTLMLRRVGADLSADAYGPGAAWLIDRADAVAGLRDDVSGLSAVEHPLVRRLCRTFAGVRLPATGRVFHHLVAAVLGQKVTGKEAGHGYRRMLWHFGSEPVPGPAGAVPPGLMLPPGPAEVAATPYWAFHPWGIEQKRADTVRRAAAFAVRLEQAVDSASATRLMTSLPGVGVWTAAEVVRVAYGDGDAVSVGDYHHKNTVAWALAGEPRGTDERMLELLEPFRGHRGRVVTLLELAGQGAPKFGPRMPVRSFARF